MNIDAITEQYALTASEKELLIQCWAKQQKVTLCYCKAIWNEQTQQIEIYQLPEPSQHPNRVSV